MQEKTENFTKIILRLSYFLENQGDNFNKLAVKIGLSNSYFSKMLKNNGSLGEDIIRKILLFYENLNSEWLILGVGNMYKNDIRTKSTEITQSNNLEKSLDTDFQYKDSEKNDTKQENSEKNSTIELLLARLDSQSREIGRLEEKIEQLQAEKNIIREAAKMDVACAIAG